MNVFIKPLVCISIFLLVCKSVTAQTDTIYISMAQAEDFFLRQNLELIAERLNIDIAEAEIMQARLWPNPTFVFEDVNFWMTENQLEEGEDGIVVPPLFGSQRFGRNTQFFIGIEQVILLGGKRRKLVDVERVSRDIATLHFEELLRSLKVELRNICAEMLFLQEFRKVLERQRTSLEALIANQRNQVAQGNVSQSELMRLQASLLEVRSEINEMQREMNQQQRELKVLLNISEPVHIVILATERNTKSPTALSFNNLIDLADMHRPDLIEARAQRRFYEKTLRYERSHRIPDIALNATFNRADNVVMNFVAFGVSMDLPIFDRNQGNIRAAKIGIKQSETLETHKQLEVFSEINEALQNYILAYDFNRQIAEDFIFDLDEMLENYTRNFIHRNIGILEFLDFFEAYIENKRTILEAHRDIKISFEELQYAVGVELVNQL